ncbi:hypothetical protein HOE425_330125 [Hoeflea sp. EC-HK425]|nr:hypothetical protein HOE425_330125 [Hoeflea sp. EC-HK425]
MFLLSRSAHKQLTVTYREEAHAKDWDPIGKHDAGSWIFRIGHGRGYQPDHIELAAAITSDQRRYARGPRRHDGRGH